MKHVQLYILIFCGAFILGLYPHLLGESSIENRLRLDTSLIAPGIGSNTILIGDEIDSVIQKKGRERFKISKPSKTGELFQDVFHLDNTLDIYFNTLYYNENDNYTLCVYNGKVVAILGLNNSVTTIDGVNLKSGINNIIFYYGNNNLLRLRKGSHGLYAYPASGIAVIDDDMNDTIDLYIIFSPRPAR